MAKQPKQIESLRHGEARRPIIPTAEYEPIVDDALKAPIMVAYDRRNPDLDPQLVWRGKDLRDWSDLVVPAPPLYIQEKVQPKALVDDLLRQSRERAAAGRPVQLDLFADFNGIPDGATATDFYRHDANWTNRLILGDSLQVMASLAEREGLRGQVQCIYIDPPYGIKFNSNFQWSTTSRDVKDGKSDHITREPEQVKAFRDTWRDGIHSYLTYLRDRLTVARDLLTDSGSIFIQIGSENQHLVRNLCDEIFGPKNFVEFVCFKTRMALSGRLLEGVYDYILWYAKDINSVKFRRLFYKSEVEGDNHWNRFLDENLVPHGMTREQVNLHALLPANSKIYQLYALYPVGPFSTGIYDFKFEGEVYSPPAGRSWKSPQQGMIRLARASRIEQYASGKTLRYRLFLDDYPVSPHHNIWTDTAPPTDKIFVVQTSLKVVQRCLLMTTDPGDLVLDPTCGSGTTAYMAEQWGRRWITIDTSRVALALARARLMGARYPYYLLADSRAGQQREAELRGAAPSSAPVFGDIRHGFVYERVPHITLKSIANNAEIDVIWEKYQAEMEPLRAEINRLAGEKWEEWEVPRPEAVAQAVRLAAQAVQLAEGEKGGKGAGVEELLARWWELRVARQREIDASIAAAADQEYLYDRPYEDRNTVRVAGPFTVESLSPHRVVAADDERLFRDELQPLQSGYVFREERAGYAGDGVDFSAVVIENLRAAGVQQAHKEGRIHFTALTGWPGDLVCAEGRYLEADSGIERRAGIFIGPEFGTVARPDLVRAAREAADAGFDVLIACAFNYDAHSAEFERLGKVPILKARMNADLHMASDLANTGAGNLFVIFGEPDIEIRDAAGGQIEVEIRGVDVFHPQSGEVRSSGPDDIACWFIDTDYNDESFFVRHAYFLGMNDPYGALKTTLKAEIDAEAWETLYRSVSRPFPRPSTGRIAVKVINHLGDEVMKVFGV